MPAKPKTHDLSKRARGRWGEDLAAAHYRRVGYDVIDRNWRCEHGEIDLVLRADRLIVFCEVKARRSAGFGGAVAAVTYAKQRRIRRLAAMWLSDHALEPVDVRFDVAAITGVDLEVYEAAF